MGYTIKRIGHESLEKRFYGKILGDYYEIRLVSDLELFIKYKTTGSVSKVEVKLGIPPRITLKLVDDRSCSVTHRANFHFHFYVTPINEASNPSLETILSVEINRFSNIFLNLLEGYSSLLSGSLAQLLSQGKLCKCGGDIGKERIEIHKQIYLNTFRDTLHSIHNEIAKNFNQILEQVFQKSFSMIIPISLNLDKIDDHQSLKKQIYYEFFKAKPSKEELIRLNELKTLKEVNFLLIGLKGEKLKKEFPEFRLNQIFEKIEKIVSEIVAIQNQFDKRVEERDLEKPESIEFFIKQKTKDTIHSGPWDHIPFGYCVRTPGEFGKMNPYIYPENIGLSKRIDEKYGEFINAKELLDDFINQGREVLLLTEILDFQNKQLETLIDTVSQKIEGICLEISEVITFKQLYYNCTGNREPFAAHDIYRDFLWTINNPQFGWSDPPPENDLRLAERTRLSFKDTFKEMEVENENPMSFDTFITKLPATIDSELQREVISKALYHIKASEILRTQNVESLNNLVIIYNKLDMNKKSDILRAELNVLVENLKLK